MKKIEQKPGRTWFSSTKQLLFKFLSIFIFFKLINLKNLRKILDNIYDNEYHYQ